jgi:hypothetical protein
MKKFKHEENSIICHYSINRSCIDATAQNKKDMKKVLFVLTSHSELETQEKKQGFGQKNLLLLITS